MNFDPNPKTKISLDGKNLKISEHPSVSGIPFCMAGSQARVFQVSEGKDKFALKVFDPIYREPYQVKYNKQIEKINDVPGVKVADRIVINPKHHYKLIGQYPELVYSVLMPWIEGPTWVEVLSKKEPINIVSSRKIALAIAKTLSNLESRNIAHCDVASTNIIIPLLAKNNKNSVIEFVDFADIYSTQLESPPSLPKGTNGYGHKTAKVGLWNQYADRFSAAVLIAEVLGWSNQEIRDRATPESFFLEYEMQKDGEKFELLFSDLEKRWGSAIAIYFKKAWFSDKLEDCPSLGSWYEALVDSQTKTCPDDLNNGKKEHNDYEIKKLMDKANKFENSDEFQKAINVYKEVLELSKSDSGWIQEIPAIIARLEKEMGSITKPLEPVVNTKKKTFSSGIPESIESGTIISKRATVFASIAVAVGIIIVIWWDLISSVEIDYLVAIPLSYSILSLISGASQLLFLRYAVDNKLIWTLVSAVGGGLLGILMSNINFLNIMSLVLGGIIGLGVGYFQTRLLDQEYKQYTGKWIPITGVGWAIAWWLAYLASYEYFTSFSKALAAVTVIVLSGIVIVPIINKIKNLEM